MDYQALLTNAVRRKFKAQIDELGEVELFDLSSSEVINVLNEASTVDDSDPAAAQIFMAKWACRLLKGEAAPDEEIAQIRENVSAAVLGQIYQAGLKAIGDKAEHEKN